MPEKTAEDDYNRTRTKESNKRAATSPPDLLQSVEDALQALRNARDPDEKERAIKTLERAVQNLRGQSK